MVGGNSVSQRVRPTRILRHVSPDSAGLLARWIRRVEITLVFGCLRDLKIHDARLEHRTLIAEIQIQNAIHAREGNDNAPRAWNCAAAQPRARASTDNRDFLLIRNPDDRGDVVRRFREDHQIRPRLVDAPVVFI